MTKNKIIWIFILFLICSVSFAHQDRIIRLEQGKLVGLPSEFQPASFSIEKKKISIGRNFVTIPNCIWNRFGKVKEEDLFFTASWYHKKSTLPPYILIEVKEDRGEDTFQLLLNLETLEILQFQKNMKTSNLSWSYQDVDVSQGCSSLWAVQEIQSGK